MFRRLRRLGYSRAPGPSLPAGTTMAASKDLAGDATSNTTEQLQASFRKVDCPGSAYHGVDVGKQGMDAAGFVQFASSDPAMSSAGYRPLSNSGSKNAIKKKFQSLFKLCPAAARAPRSPTTGDSHLSDIVLAVSASAREEAAELATGTQKFSHADPVVRHAVFWCIGGDNHGRNGGSGGNCERVSARDGWCSGLGKCEDGCGFQALNAKQRAKQRPAHMCRVRLHMVWTLAGVLCGEVLIYINGVHVPPGVEWKAPKPAAAGISDEALCSVECGSGTLTTAVQAQEQIKKRSPAAASNLRRLPSLSAVGRLKKNILYSSASGNERVGDWSQCDSIVRDHALSRNAALANARGDDPIILHYDCSADNFQICVSTYRNLCDALLLGDGSDVLTDDKNDLTTSRVAFTTMLAVDRKHNVSVPLAASVSSSQGQSSAETFFGAVRDAVPCSEDCQHTYFHSWSPSGAYVLKAGCPAATHQPGCVKMDSDLSAKKGISDSGAVKFSACNWHSQVAFTEGLSHTHAGGTCSKPTGSGAPCSSDYGLSGKMLGAMALGKRICLRARDMQQLDGLCREFASLVRAWKSGGLLPSIGSN